MFTDFVFNQETAVKRKRLVCSSGKRFLREPNLKRFVHSVILGFSFFPLNGSNISLRDINICLYGSELQCEVRLVQTTW